MEANVGHNEGNKNIEKIWISREIEGERQKGTQSMRVIGIYKNRGKRKRYREGGNERET